ncbi:type I pantothenate kinase [Actinoallomurus sp. NPDC052274]|uniref:type I pantothenate kinase n=1 Tax=Actinoallomurus sp. NPDC052274 TaxID=3155420 RepID=UPI0034170996
MIADGEGMPSPYVEFGREEWRALRAEMPLSLTPDDLEALRGLNDRTDFAEVEEVYLPLARLIGLFAAADGRLRDAVGAFLGDPVAPTPFVIGIAGSVAVGKSTVARLVRTLLARGPGEPKVELVTTDGFLYPNATLAERGLMNRKGFPESYDRRALLGFVSAVKAGAAELSVPVYDPLSYDIVPEARQVVRRPDILIVEGLNVLQTARPGGLALSDLFDFSIYVDARVNDARQWYIDRFFALRRTVFTDERSFFHPYARVDPDEAAAYAERMWREINEVNLVANILPTRERATLVLCKDHDHRIHRVRLRRI